MYKKSDLALYGGAMARTSAEIEMFPGGLSYDEKEEQAVMEVLKSKRLFRYYGPYESVSRVEDFEKAFAAYSGTEYCLALNSCTNALIAALIAAGLQPGDEVIVPAYTFVATVAAVVAANAIPVICEVDDTLTLDPKDIKRNITSKTKAILPVHMRGAPCQMDEIMAIAKKHDLKVIEDVAQATGGSYKGKKLGSIGDAGCFSLQYHKVITSGEGGVLITNDQKLYYRSLSVHDTGANWRTNETTEDDIPFSGFNMRMTEIQGALGYVQLGKLDDLIGKMRTYKKKIKDAISKYDVVFRRIIDDGEIAVCLMFFLPDTVITGHIADALKAEGLDAGTMGQPDIPDWHIYINWKHILNRRGNNDVGFPFTLSDRTYSADMCPKTLDYLRRAIHLDINPLWTDQDVEEVITGLDKVLSVLMVTN